jgi:hypothetical protein
MTALKKAVLSLALGNGKATIVVQSAEGPAIATSKDALAAARRLASENLQRAASEPAAHRVPA